MKEELGDAWLTRPLPVRRQQPAEDIERQLRHFVTGRYAAAHILPDA